MVVEGKIISGGVMKKILILGAGAQGSTVARRMDEEPEVAEIICADYDEASVNSLTKELRKARGMQVNGRDVEDIKRVAQSISGGVDLMVNAMPIGFEPGAMEAALQIGTNYQDFVASAPMGVDWEENLKNLYGDMAKRFAAINRTALIGTGSAPGIICVVARHAVGCLDTCQAIGMYVYEGVKAKRFLPFWWSPETAYGDMADEPYSFIDGKIIRRKPFSLPIYKQFKGFDEPVRLVEHAHEEPVMMGLNAKTHFKGASEIIFKYGGAGVEFAEPLYQMGMLSPDPVEVDGATVVPLKLAIQLTPPAPKYYDEIKAILDEGLESDTGAMVVEAIGLKDGKKTVVETYVNAPGCVESFEKAGLTAEMYLTGQAGALFTKLFVHDEINQKGLISSDMLSDTQVTSYLSYAGKLDITLDTTIKEG